jgi:hypothetical protein
VAAAPAAAAAHWSSSSPLTRCSCYTLLLSYSYNLTARCLKQVDRCTEEIARVRSHIRVAEEALASLIGLAPGMGAAAAAAAAGTVR